MVPHYIWKAVYIPKSQQASAYWEKMMQVSQYEIISVQELKQRTGIDVFPQITQKEKDTVIDFTNTKISIKENKMKKYEPFDGNQSISIDELTIENSEDVSHLWRFRNY